MGFGLVSAPTVYDASGQTPSPKMWTGRVSSDSDGLWSVDYSSAGFTLPPRVFAQAEATSADNADRNFASVRHDTVTTTSCSGTASNAVTVGLLGATVLTDAQCDIDILAIGV